MSGSEAPNHSADLVIVANRLPVDRVVNPDGSTEWRRSPGGLVTALEPKLSSCTQLPNTAASPGVGDFSADTRMLASRSFAVCDRARVGHEPPEART